MSSDLQLAETLGRYVKRSGYSLGQLERLAGVPKRTIANWLEGRVQRPRERNDLLKLAQVMHLNEIETSLLLRAAGHPSLAELLAQAGGGPSSSLLSPWAEAIRRQEQAPFQAIADLPYFVGREEELVGIERLLLAGGRATICSLQGMGGVGKTALAAHLAYRLRPHFPDGVLWARVDLSDTMSILRSFAAVYGRDVSQYTDLDSRGRVVRDLLASRRALVVLDNARSSADIEPLLPPTGACAVLITTRQQNLFVASGANSFLLGPFSDGKEEALRLFGRTLGDDWVRRERAALLEIARLLGQLPLAIAIAASRMAYEPGWTAAEFLALLGQEDKRLNQLTYDNQSVRLSAGLSYAALDAAERAFFAVLGLFAGENLSVEAVAAVSGLAAEEAQGMLRKLYALSLLQVGQQGRYRLHPLLRDCAREKFEAGGDTELALARLVNYYLDYVESRADDYPALDEELDNVLAALEAADCAAMSEALVRGLVALLPFLRARGLFGLALKHLERGLRAAEALGDLWAVATLRYHLASIPRRQGDYRRAEPILRETLALARQIGHLKIVSQTLAELGQVAAHVGEHARADAYLEEGLALARQVQDPELLCCLLAHVGGRVNVTGDPARAEACYREGLSLARQSGLAHSEVLFLNNVGVIAAERGHIAAAEKAFGASLALARQLGQQELVCASLNNLGEMRQQRRDFAQAEVYYRESLALSRQIEHHKYTILVLNNLGELATARGDYGQALAHRQEALALARRWRHVGMIGANLVGLGKLALVQGDARLAAAYFQECLALVEQTSQHEALAGALNDWGELYLEQGSLKPAAVAFDRLHELAEQLGSRVWLAVANYGRARLAAARGELVEAQRRGQDSLRALEATGHGRAAGVRQWLAGLTDRTGADLWRDSGH